MQPITSRAQDFLKLHLTYKVNFLHWAYLNSTSNLTKAVKM